LWENTLNEKDKNDVNNLFATKRINIQTNKNDNIQIPRRIIKIKRNQNNN
jgi:hypothetical protein